MLLGFRLLVCGGRSFSNRALLWSALEEIDLNHCIDCIIEGEASGADLLAREWAETRGCPFHPFPAEWDNVDRPGAIVKMRQDGRLYDAAAGPYRNTRMLVEGQATHVLAAPGGSGTANMIAQARAAGLPVRHLKPSI